MVRPPRPPPPPPRLRASAPRRGLRLRSEARWGRPAEVAARPGPRAPGRNPRPALCDPAAEPVPGRVDARAAGDRDVAGGQRPRHAAQLHGGEGPRGGGAQEAAGGAAAVCGAQEPHDRADGAALRPLRVPVPEGHREPRELVRPAPQVRARGTGGGRLSESIRGWTRRVGNAATVSPGSVRAGYSESNRRRAGNMVPASS